MVWRDVHARGRKNADSISTLILTIIASRWLAAINRTIPIKLLSAKPFPKITSLHARKKVLRSSP